MNVDAVTETMSMSSHTDTDAVVVESGERIVKSRRIAHWLCF